MSIIFISCLMHCCTQVLAPTTDWDDQDRAAMDTARKHCSAPERKYNKCLVKFKKVEQSIYTAICGAENN